MQKKLNRKKMFSLMLVMSLFITILAFVCPVKVKAANTSDGVIGGGSVLDSYTWIDSSLVGKYSSDGYQYNVTFSWKYSPYSVHGYYVGVQRVSDGVWVIKNTATTDPWCTRDDIYGLRPGFYRFYVSAIEGDYQLMDTHYGVLAYVDYSGKDYGFDAIP